MTDTAHHTVEQQANFLQPIDVASDVASGVEAGEMCSTSSVAEPSCDQCGNEFKPRHGSGGKPQRFCSTKCRLAFHSEGQRPQHAPTCDTVTEEIRATTPEATAKPIMHEPWQGRIDRQYSIEIAGVNNCGSIDVHIEQEGQHGYGEESAVVIVSASNAVRFARMVLWAAGFKAVTIAAMPRPGQYLDIEDGAEADQFTWEV